MKGWSDGYMAGMGLDVVRSRVAAQGAPARASEWSAVNVGPLSPLSFGGVEQNAGLEITQ